MDTINLKDHHKGNGSPHDLYFAIVYEGKGKPSLLGWDTVDQHSVSKFQQMLGVPTVDVFVINLAHPGKPMYFWNMNNWESANEYWKQWLPKEVQMALLCGAL